MLLKKIGNPVVAKLQDKKGFVNFLASPVWGPPLMPPCIVGTREELGQVKVVI